MNVRYELRHSWAKVDQSVGDFDKEVSRVICSVVARKRYHRGISGLFCGLYQSFCDCLSPIDACAEDVEEEGF